MLQHQRSFTWNSWLVAEAILLAALCAVAGLLAAWGWSVSRESGVVAAATAFIVCWMPNALSLLVVTICRDPSQSLVGMLLGMAIRMGVPAVVAVALLQTGHWLVAVGVLPMILVLYLLALVVETVLSLWILGAFRVSVKAA